MTEKVFKDIVGNVLRVGDAVVTTSYHYKELICAEVIGFAPNSVRIRIINPDKSYYVQNKDGYVTTKGSNQLCLVSVRT